jgi:hypothetical protein
LPTPCFIESSKPTPVDCYSRLPIRESSPFPVNLWALARLFLFFVFVICSTHFERRYVTNVICFTINLFSSTRFSALPHNYATIKINIMPTFINILLYRLAFIRGSRDDVFWISLFGRATPPVRHNFGQN